jgi:hypothetical protein
LCQHDRIPDRNNLRGERIYLSSRFQIFQSIMVGRTRQSTAGQVIVPEREGERGIGKGQGQGSASDLLARPHILKFAESPKIAPSGL